MQLWRPRDRVEPRLATAGARRIDARPDGRCRAHRGPGRIPRQDSGIVREPLERATAQRLRGKNRARGREPARAPAATGGRRKESARRVSRVLRLAFAWFADLFHPGGWNVPSAPAFASVRQTWT